MFHAVFRWFATVGAAAAISAAADSPGVFRFRAATKAEMQKCRLRTDGALVIEAVPAAVADDLKPGDLLAFVAAQPATDATELESILRGAAGKPVEVLFHRDGKAETRVLPLTPAMLRSSRGTETVRPPDEKTGNLVADQWSVRAGASGTSSLDAGRLHLVVAKGFAGAANAGCRTPIKGDFDLELDYAMIDFDPLKILTGGFGVRLESAKDWNGDRIVTVDRLGYDKQDLVAAGRAREVAGELSAKPLTPAGSFRVRRRGDRFAFAWREENGKDWRELGELEARVSPELQLWMTAFKTGNGDLKVSVSRFALTSPTPPRP